MYPFGPSLFFRLRPFEQAQSRRDLTVLPKTKNAISLGAVGQLQQASQDQSDESDSQRSLISQVICTTLWWVPALNSLCPHAFLYTSGPTNSHGSRVDPYHVPRPRCNPRGKTERKSRISSPRGSSPTISRRQPCWRSLPRSRGRPFALDVPENY